MNMSNKNNTITAIYLIKNEENFIKESIESVESIADEIIIFDTGSSDKTTDMIKSIKSEKVRLYLKGEKKPEELIELKNEMSALVKTEWFWILDGDEIYGEEANLIKEELLKVPQDVHRLQIEVIDLVKNLNMVYSRYIGKIFRTKEICFIGEFPYEKVTLKENPDIDIKNISIKLIPKIKCFHLCYFPRSSKDLDVGYARHWRRLPYPIKPYFGPWPKALTAKFSYSKQIGFRFIIDFFVMFVTIIFDRLFVKLVKENPSKRA